MKKYIRCVVLVCALNGVGVWAEPPCAFKIISPEFGAWPAKSTTVEKKLLDIMGLPLVVNIPVNYCVRARDSQKCGRGDSDGWNGYYCNNGPDRHHFERTDGKVGFPPEPCPNKGSTIVPYLDGPTKVLSKNPCSHYSPGWW
jgi:hypothetical protein